VSHARARRFEVSPAALGSIALHAAVAAALMISWGSHDLKVGAVVPVTIVSSAPDTDTRPAAQADETQTAQADQTVAEAPPEPVPPPPAPAPTPTPPSKAAKPAEKTPAPLPTKPAAKPAEKSLDLDNLYASLTKPARNAARPSSAQTGPTRAETAPVARQTVGTGLATGAAIQGLAEDLQKRWNPNCEVEGGRDVLVRVTFHLGVGGQVVGEVGSQIKGAVTPVSKAGAERAVRAVYAASPFRGLPRELYNETINVNFNAREACAP
jgi:outer membrane biosynthesis protein TonB